MMGQETTGVPATEAQVPLVAHDTHKHGLGDKVKMTLANAKERIHGVGHSSATNPTPTSTATPTSTSSTSSTTTPRTSTAAPSEHVKKGSHLSPLKSGREVHPPNPDGGRVGDINSPRTPGAIPRREGDPASPKIPTKDWGERIYEKLPFSHVNPYSVGHPVERPNANPYVTGSDSTEPTAPGSTTPTSKQSPKLVAKIKNLVTGQKPTQGAATENATLNTPDIPAAGARGGSEGYAQQPTERSTGDFYDRARSKMHRDEKHVADEKWPSPSRPGASEPKEGANPAHRT